MFYKSTKEMQLSGAPEWLSFKHLDLGSSHDLRTARWSPSRALHWAWNLLKILCLLSLALPPSSGKNKQTNNNKKNKTKQKNFHRTHSKNKLLKGFFEDWGGREGRKSNSS